MIERKREILGLREREGKKMKKTDRQKELRVVSNLDPFENSVGHECVQSY